MKKRILSLVLVLSMFVNVAINMSITVNAETEGNYEYRITNGKAILTKCNNIASENVIIPSTLGNCPLTAIGSSAFKDLDLITNIKIPDGVQKIEYDAFRNCDGLSEITVPDSVTEIGSNAFNFCDNLKKVRLSNNITLINSGMFNQCPNLSDIVIPNNIKTIGSSAFKDLDLITSIEIPNGVQKIEYDAFRDCDGLTEITVPDSVTEIGSNAFKNCGKLTVYGYENGYTQEYCEKNDIPFIIIGHSSTTKSEMIDGKNTEIVTGAFQGKYTLTASGVKKVTRGLLLIIEKSNNKNYARFISYPTEETDDVPAYECGMTVSYDTKEKKYIFSGLENDADYNNIVKQSDDLFGGGLLTNAVDNVYDLYISEFSNTLSGDVYGTYTPGIFSMYGQIGTFDVTYTDNPVMPEIDMGDIESILGTYSGVYTADQGETGGTLTISKNSGDYYATFEFYPISENPDVESGSYKMKIEYDSLHKSYKFIGTEWQEKASSYEFVDFDAKFSNDICSGTVFRHSTGGKTGTFEFKKNAKETKIKSINDFELEKNNNSFVHDDDRNRPGAGFVNVQDYSIPLPLFCELIKNSNKGEIAEIARRMYKYPWEGSCYGIAATMGINYINNSYLKEMLEGNECYFYAGRPCDNNSLLNYINYYQLSQYLEKSGKTANCVSYTYNMSCLKGLINFVNNGDSLKDCLKKLFNYLNDNKVALLGYSHKNGEGHAILALRSRYDKTANKYIIDLYDENSVDNGTDIGNFSKMEISADYSTFTIFDENKNAILTNIDYKSIYFVDLDKVYNRNNATNTNGKAKIIFPSSAYFIMTNSIGNKLVYDRGNMSGDMSLYSIDFVANGNGSDVIISVDESEKYTMTQLDDNMSFDVYSESNLLAIDCTQASEVSFGLDSGVSISGEKYDFTAFASIIENDDVKVFSVECSSEKQTEIFVNNEQCLQVNSTGKIRGIDAKEYMNANKKNLTIMQNGDSSIIVQNNSSITSFGSSVSEWAKEEVEDAYNKKLIPENLIGKDLTQNITRSEFASIAVQLYETWKNEIANSKNTTSFQDIDNDKNRVEILKAYNLGITAGTSDTTFDPDTLITREQLATMLCRTYKRKEWVDWTIQMDDNFTLNYSGVQKFNDDNEISEYAKPSVYFMVKYNVIKGIWKCQYLCSRNLPKIF